MYLANALNLAFFEEIIQGIPISRVAPFGRGVLCRSGSGSVIWIGTTGSVVVDVLVAESSISTSSGGCTDCRIVSVDVLRWGVCGLTTSAADVLGVTFLFPLTVAEGEGALSTLVLVESTETVDLRFAEVVGVIFLGTVPFLGGGSGGVEVVEEVDWVEGAGEVLWGLRDGGVSSIDEVAVVRFVLVERFDATEALRARTGDFDGVGGEVTPRDVLAVFTLVVEALETADTVLILFVDWTVELLFLADEGPSDAVLKVEDASLAVETRDWGLERESVGLSPGPLTLRSVFDGVGTFRTPEARDLTEEAEELTRSVGLLDA